MKKQKYDLIFSVGNNCITSYHLREAGLQKQSYPFDWLAHMTVSLFCHFFENNFSDFLIKENLYEFTQGQSILLKDKNTKISFDHDFTRLENLDNEFPKVFEKYQRRIKRLYHNFKKAKKILMVYSAEGAISNPSTELKDFNKFISKYPEKQINLLIAENIEDNDKRGINALEILDNNIFLAKVFYTKEEKSDWRKSIENYQKLFKMYKLNLSYLDKFKLFLYKIKIKNKKLF